jgi:PIN domain nuclease of toxin-antitoxin system
MADEKKRLVTEPTTGSVVDNASWYKQRYETLNTLVHNEREEKQWYKNKFIACKILVEQEARAEAISANSLLYQKKQTHDRLIASLCVENKQTHDRLVSSLEARNAEILEKDTTICHLDEGLEASAVRLLSSEQANELLRDRIAELVAACTMANMRASESANKRRRR